MYETVSSYGTGETFSRSTESMAENPILQAILEYVKSVDIKMEGLKTNLDPSKTAKPDNNED